MRRVGSWLACLGLVSVACGRYAFEPCPAHVNSTCVDERQPLQPLDASGRAIDAPPSKAGLCSNWSAFTAPVRINELSGTNTQDSTMRLRHDGLEALISFSGTLMPATRPTTSATWTAGAVYDAFAPVALASGSYSPDGLTLYADGRAQDGGADLYTATRPSLTSRFAAPTKLTELSTGPGDEEHPFLSADGLRLYYSTDLRGDLEQYVATRTTAADAFAMGQPLAAVSSLENEWLAVESADGLELFFNRGPDIWHASRADKNATWSGLLKLNEVSSGRLDEVGSVSADGKHLYLSYNATGYNGTMDLHVATRACND